MALADRLKKPPQKGVDGALEALNNEDRVFLREALVDLSYRHVDIASALQAEGYRVTPDQVRKYRIRMNYQKGSA